MNLPNDINEAFVEEVMDIDDSKTTSSQVQEEAIQVTKTPETKSNKNKRQRSANKKSDKPSKRRKRIKEIKSDSDSDGSLKSLFLNFGMLICVCRYVW